MATEDAFFSLKQKKKQKPKCLARANVFLVKL